MLRVTKSTLREDARGIYYGGSLEIFGVWAVARLTRALHESAWFRGSKGGSVANTHIFVMSWGHKTSVGHLWTNPWKYKYQSKRTRRGCIGWLKSEGPGCPSLDTQVADGRTGTKPRSHAVNGSGTPASKSTPLVATALLSPRTTKTSWKCWENTWVFLKP